MTYKTDVERKAAALKSRLKGRVKYCLKYPERIKATKLKWYKANPEKARQDAAKQRARNPEKVAAWVKDWSIRNRAILNAKKSKRMAARRGAMPKWANEFFIEEIYDLAKRRTKMLGFPWHVDHIVPLKSKLVC